ncbi:hypothetical protein N431DRAFT_391394 [Stipitochalara longipes BDJ]|nr:hypothetical protein N431DRAFT_391394 [Stipitochalara longipes BDJ]
MHLKSVATALTLIKTHSHHDTEPPKVYEPHKIITIKTVEELDQILDDHHHRRVVVFCVTTNYKDPDVSEEGWFHHYGMLNDVHFVRVNLDVSCTLEDRLQPKVRPCWVTFHKGEETGWSSGGMKRFLQLHSERKGFGLIDGGRECIWSNERRVGNFEVWWWVGSDANIICWAGCASS